MRGNRQMFKILRTVLVIIVISPALLAASAKGKRPNILFIPIDAKDSSKVDVVDHFEKIFKTRGVAQESNTPR